MSDDMSKEVNRANGFIFTYSYQDESERPITGISHVSIPYEVFKEVLSFFNVVVTDSLSMEMEVDDSYLEKLMTRARAHW